MTGKANGNCFTDWMLDSQTKLIENYALSKKEYEEILLPDVKLLKEYPQWEKFKNKKNFLGPSEDRYPNHKTWF